MAVKFNTEILKESFFKHGILDRGVIGLMFLVLVFGGVAIYQSNQPKTYSPLGYYSVQQVGYDGFLTDKSGQPTNPPPKQLLPTGTYKGDLDPLPVFVVESGLETLPVHAEKCLAEGEKYPVQVVGNVRWRNLDPVGATIDSSTGTVHRQPGCQVFDYNYTIPFEMLQRLQLLAAEGIRESKWQVQGDSTPTEPQGNQLAATKYWESTDFIIRYVGPGALQETTSTTGAPSVAVNPFPDTP